MMGGLIDGSTVKGDLWMLESSSGNLSCFPIATVSEGPGPRVGHASLLVGNAFIVFGGDTKVDENDTLDDTLYLLNTCMPYLPALLDIAIADCHSYSLPTMVALNTSGSSAHWTIRTYSEHSWLQTLRFWRAGRRILLQ
jgi:hypothetical protein